MMKVKKTVKAAIFDFDGTLVDSETTILKSLILAAKHFNIMEGEDFRFAIGHTEKYLVEGLNKKYDVPKDFFQKVDEIFAGIPPSEFVLFEGVLETLTKLKDAGVKIAIGSNSVFDYVKRISVHCGIDTYIDVYSTYAPPLLAKPKPDIFLNAAKLLNVSIDEAIVVEDSPAGISAGKTGGILTFALTNSFSSEHLKEADIIINKIDEIFQHIEI